MREDSTLKILFLIVLAYNIEVFINPIFMNVNIIIPFSFLTYSYFAYKDKNGFTASSSFLIGLFMDLVSGSYIGLNGLIYCMTTYVINSYKYVFRLFSYLQISIFFGIIASTYVALTHLFLNINNFSYLTLLLTLTGNTIFSFLISIARVYKPIIFKRRGI